MEPGSLLALPPTDALLFFGPLLLAAGVELHATLIVLVLAGGFPWLAPPPGSLGQLSSPWVLAPAATLYLAELASESRFPSGLFWHAGQALVRPLAGISLGVLLLEGAGPVVRTTGALALGLGAWAVHAAVRGADVKRGLGDRGGPSRTLLALGADAAAVGLLVLALDLPAWGAAAGGGGILALAAVLPRTAPAALFGLHLAWDRAWSLLGRSGWRGPEELPTRVREAGSAAAGGGGHPPRGSPAAALGLEGSGDFRAGWLVSDDRGVRLVRRGDFRRDPHGVVLCAAGAVGRGGVFDRIPVRPAGGDGGDGGPAVVVLSKRGPDPEGVRARMGFDPESDTG